MICYAFAVPHEGEDLLAAMTEKEAFSIGKLGCVTGKYRGRYVVVAFLGMGMERSAARALELFNYFRIKIFVLAGYGGALVPQLKLGQVVVSNNFSSEEVLQFVRLLPDFQFAKFCSTDELVATPERRKAFVEATECQVVDMETGSVAEVLYEKGVPFLAVRAISDTVDKVLPQGALAAAYDSEENRPCIGRLLLYLATHPKEIGPFRAFVQSLPQVRKGMTEFLHQLTDELPSGI